MTKEDIYYQGLQLDRESLRRKNPKWLKRQWQHRKCRVLLLHNDRNLVVWDIESGVAPAVISLSRAEAETMIPSDSALVFLGVDHSMPWFAADVSRIAETHMQVMTDQHRFIDLREMGWLLCTQDAALLAYARGLLHWNRHNGFCSHCGGVTVSREGGHWRLCSNDHCGRFHFPRIDPAVIMLVEDRSDPKNPRCLLGRNNRFPQRLLSTLAGFVDPLESLEDCVVREVAEEAGILVDKVDYQASQPWPFPSSMMFGFRARALSTEIKVDGVEIVEAHWFQPEQLKKFGEWGDSDADYCLPRKDSIARYLIDSWVAEVMG